MEAEAVQVTALTLARLVRLELLATAAVQSLAAMSDVALARLWLLDLGDVCQSCPMDGECPDQTRCLHLVASAGSPGNGNEDWSRTDGTFRRVPLGVGKIGRVGESGTAMLLHDMSERSSWIAAPDWAAREGIRAFAAQPLISGSKVLGVLAVFRRARIDAPAFQSLRVLADHVAAAVDRARAFERAERRQAAAEREAARLRAEIRRRQAVSPDPTSDVSVLSIGEWRRHERANLEAALRRSGGRIYGKGGAAEILGVPPTTLASRLKALGVSSPGRRG
jgi:transcriptional regulator with GAF, ATPase, and Fis domain